MPPTTENDLRSKQERVEKLRQQIAAEREKQVTRETDSTDELAGIQLDTEAARLEAELDEAKDRNKPGNIKAEISPINTAHEDLKRALDNKAAMQAAREARVVNESTPVIDAGQALADATAEANAAAPAGVAAATVKTNPKGSE